MTNLFPPKKISTNWLLWIYFIIPIIIGFIFVDYFFFDQIYKKNFSLEVDSNRLFLIFFVYPHVIMSLLTLWDGEYFDFYKEQIFSKGIIPYLIFFPMVFISLEIFEIVYLFFTIRHFLGQQMGVEKLLSGTNNVYSGLSKYFQISIIMIFYGSRILPKGSEFTKLLNLMEREILFSEITWIYCFAISLILFFDALGRSSKTKVRKGKICIFFNNSSLLFILLTLKLEYIFLAFLIPRAIHDFTAITFYSVENYNRNLCEVKNIPTKIFNSVFGKSFFSLLIISLIISNSILEFSRFGSTFPQYLLLFLGAAHYYFDGVFWKHGSIHRKEIYLN